MASSAFSGGKELEKKLKELAEKISKSSEVRTGFLEGSTEPDGQSTAFVASCNEFGTQNGEQQSVIPPRPFFRPTIAKGAPQWGGQLGKLLKANGYDAEVALSLMGELISGELVQSIQEVDSPKLAASTIKRKGFEKPLIDTGTMWKSTGYQVDSGGKNFPYKGGKS